MFLKFLLIPLEFHILYPNPTHLPSFHTCILPLQPPSKNKTQQNIKKKKKQLCHGRCNVSHCGTQYILLPKQLYFQMCIVMSHWSGFKSSDFCFIVNNGSSAGLLWDILLLPCLVGSCSFGSTGPASLWDPTGHRLDRYWGSQTQCPGSEPRWWLNWSSYPFSCSQVTRVRGGDSSPVLTHSDPSRWHPCYQSQPYYAAQVICRPCSLECCSERRAVPSHPLKLSQGVGPALLVCYDVPALLGCWWELSKVSSTLPAPCREQGFITTFLSGLSMFL